MTAESNLWNQIQDTRNCTEQHTSARWALGILKRLDTSWLALGIGEADASYSIGVTEHAPRGVVAAVVEPEPSMTVRLTKNTSGWETDSSISTTYLAQLTATELVSVDARVLEAGHNGGEPHPLATTLSPEEAAEGFELALADARFNQHG